MTSHHENPMQQAHPFVASTGTLTLPEPDHRIPSAGGRRIATRDPAIVQAWARRHGAEPATGEATPSGPATIDVNDGSVGIRFNFPAAGRFRPISWDEWFAHLEQHSLVFVYEEEVPDRAYALWQARGEGHHGDREDWLKAEHQLRQLPNGPGARYWFVPQGCESVSHD